MKTKTIFHCTLFLFIPLISSAQYNLIGLTRREILDVMMKENAVITDDAKTQRGAFDCFLGFRLKEDDVKTVYLACFMKEDTCRRCAVIYKASDIGDIIGAFNQTCIKTESFTWIEATGTFQYKMDMEHPMRIPGERGDFYGVLIDEL